MKVKQKFYPKVKRIKMVLCDICGRDTTALDDGASAYVTFGSKKICLDCAYREAENQEYEGYKEDKK